MKAALYTRVSTADQHTDTQLKRLRDYAKSRDFEILEYVDQRISGAKARRPALDQLLEDAHRRAFDVLLIVKLDRLARSVAHLVKLTGDLEALGVDLVVLDQSIDTTTPSGKLLFHVLASISELERDLIRERTTDGMQAARRRGKSIGRPWVVTSEVLSRMKRMRASGRSLREIAGVVGVSASTVRKALSAH